MNFFCYFSDLLRIFSITGPSFESAIMRYIQICMGTIAKPNSRKPNTTGGGRRIEFLISSILHVIIPVWDDKKDFFRIIVDFIFELIFFFAGLVLFLEEDHYVSEDFLHLLKLMEVKSFELCAKCNILSLGTYLKTFNYYTYINNNKVMPKYYLTLVSKQEWKTHPNTYIKKLSWRPHMKLHHNATEKWNVRLSREIESLGDYFFILFKNLERHSRYYNIF